MTFSDDAGLDGGQIVEYHSLDIDLDSPRSVEACKRIGVEASDLGTLSNEVLQVPRRTSFRGGKAPDTEETAAILAEHHEITQHRLLREVRRERQKLIGSKYNGLEAADHHRRSPSSKMAAALTKKSQDYQLDTVVGSERVKPETAPGDAVCRLVAKKTPRRIGKSLIIEEEAQRIATLKRRQAMELQQMLAFELRSLAREERDRLRAEKSTAREEAAEARRAKRLYMAEQARLDRERAASEKEKGLEEVAAAQRVIQQDAARRLHEGDVVRQRQVDLAAQRRAEETERKAAILESRIARGFRVRRARQLQTEREAAKKADEREAAAEAAKRAREVETEARKAAAAARSVIARAAVEEARRKRENEVHALRATTESKFAELEARAESFRHRQKEITRREKELHEEQLAELAQQRHEAARRKLEEEAKRRQEELEEKARREKQMALALEIRREQEAARRQQEKQEKDHQMRRALDRREKAEELRLEATRRKLEENAAKVELLRLEKERLRLARSKLSSESAKQREALKGHFGALRGKTQGCLSFDTIVDAVAAATTSIDGEPPLSMNVHSSGKRNDPGGGVATSNHALDSTDKGKSSSKRGLSNAVCRTARGAAGTDGTRPTVQRQRTARPASRGGGGRGGQAKGQNPATCEKEDEGKQSPRIPRPPKRPLSPAASSDRVNGNSFSGWSPRNRTAGDNLWAPTIGDPTAKIVEAKAVISERRNLGKSNARRAVLRKTADPVADLRRRYRNMGPKTSRGSIKSVDKRAGCKKSEDIQQQKGDTSPGQKNIRGPGRSEKAASTTSPQDETQAGWRGFAGEASIGDPCGEGAEAGDRLLGKERGERDVPSADHVPTAALRRRYDRELLAILEEEQAAESARERALAAAKANARVAEARAGDAATSYSKLNDKYVTTSKSAGGDNDIEQRRDTGERQTPEALSTALEATAAIADESRVEAVNAAREVKQLEEHLSRERREASERVVRISEVYEEALSALSGPHRRSDACDRSKMEGSAPRSAALDVNLQRSS